MIKVFTINILVMRSRGQTEKRKNGQKHHRTKEPKYKNQIEQNPQKRKYFNTPTIKVYDPMITRYRCGQSSFTSCDHVGRQRKAKLDKSTIGQKPQRIKISEQNQQKRKYFNTPIIKVVLSHDHKIQVWTINILVMRSRGRTENSQHGQKHHSTIVPKDKNQSGQNSQKGKYFNTPTIKVYDPMIT